MSSPPSDHMEEDAWLMKIKLKREDSAGAAKEDKSKEAPGDQVPMDEQALPADEEEEDILEPYYAHLTPVEITAFKIINTICIQNKYLNRENILHMEHIASLWRVIRRLESLLILKDRIASTSSPPSSSSPPKEN